jgi:hypothetical protein
MIGHLPVLQCNMGCDEPSQPNGKGRQVMLLGNKAVTYGATRKGEMREIRAAPRHVGFFQNASPTPRINSPMVPDSGFRLIGWAQRFVP